MHLLQSSLLRIFFYQGLLLMDRLQTAHGQEITPLSNNIFASASAVTSGFACGLVETTFDDPDWVIATSDRLLRLSLCLASPPCDATDWYDNPFKPCYKENRYFKFGDQDAEIAFVYPLASLGTVGETFDSLYVRRSVKLQFFEGLGDKNPYGPKLVGPRYVSIDVWKGSACDGFEPNTFFVTGGPGALGDYSLKIGETDANLIKDVDMRVDANEEMHHTDLYKGPDRHIPFFWNKFVVRRASKFIVTIIMTKQYSPWCHEINLEASQDFEGYVTTFTLPIFDISVPDEMWGAQQKPTVTFGMQKYVDMEINIPPDAPVGEYEFKVIVRDPTFSSWSVIAEKNFDYKVIVLFNPWSSTDSVYMGDLAKRDEYVMNEDGKLYFYDSENQKTSEKKWRFSQFDKQTLEFVLNLLVGVKSSDRADAKLVSRHFSNVVNSDKDEPINPGFGILIGRWSRNVADYSDGIVPWYWTGSDQLINKYMEKWEPVRYAQCWVFGGLLTTLLRSVGIPSRPITNYLSGHDADIDGIVDICANDKNEPVSCPFELFDMEKSDSVWNFHVWNDVYIEKGWHAVDGTPQELSDDFFQLGPASHEAIKSKSGGDHDVNFVISEVDALVRKWFFSNGNWKRNFFPKLLGQHILTKAVGSDAQEDISSSYKTPETNRHLQLTQWVVNVALTAPTGVTAGSDIRFDVTVISNSASDLSVRIFISTSAILYDGTFLALINSTEVFKDLSEGANLVIPFSVSAAYYLNWTRATNIFESIVTVEVEGNDFIGSQSALTVVTFPPPKLEVTPNTSLATKTDGIATFSFVNPLEYSIKNMTVSFSVGRGITFGGKRSVDVFVETLLAGETLSVKQAFTAIAEGIDLMTVSFSGDKVSGVSTGAHISTFPDCNGNGKPDVDDIGSGSSKDCNNNEVPDVCEPDCNGNGVPDDCDISEDPLLDCNANSIPDACDVSSGFSPDKNNNNSPDECDLDCNANGTPDDLDIHLRVSSDFNQNRIPDECDFDCNANGVSDELDIFNGHSTDTNRNGVPDECENTAADCNKNGNPDKDDIVTESSLDCNLNGVPDECDVGSGLYRDCNTNGIPDECEPDCNMNGIPDDCDVDTGTSLDCNSNGVPDECDIATGSSTDRSKNGIPDECEQPTATPTATPTDKKKPTKKPKKKQTKKSKNNSKKELPKKPKII